MLYQSLKHSVCICIIIKFTCYSTKGPAYADKAIQFAREHPRVYKPLHKVLMMMEKGELLGRNQDVVTKGRYTTIKCFKGLRYVEL